MKTNKIIIFSIITLLVLCFFFPAQKVSAQQPPGQLEVDYPNVPGAFKPTTTRTPIEQYAKYIIYFAIGIGGLMALGVIIWAGFIYLTSAGYPEKTKNAQSRITSAVLGLIILLGSWMILFTVNPNLVTFQLGGISPIVSDLAAGIYICKSEVNVVDNLWAIKKDIKDNNMKPKDISPQVWDELKTYLNLIKEHCYLVITSGDIKEGFDNNAKQAWIVPPIDQSEKYGAIFYEESDYGGKNQIIYTAPRNNMPAHFDISRLNASSIKPFMFMKNPSPNWYVKIFEFPNQNDEGRKEDGKSKTYGFKDWYYLRALDPPFEKKESTFSFDDHQFRSIKIEGKLIVIFFKSLGSGGNWEIQTEIYVLTHNSDNELNDNRPIGQWCGGIIGKFACAESMIIIPAGTY